MHIATYHPDIEKFIGEQVRAGDYSSPDEVVTDALFLLWQRQQDQAAATDGKCRGAMYESLPAPLSAWVTHQAAVMGLPDPDSFILLLIRLEKQRQELSAIHQLPYS